MENKRILNLKVAKSSLQMLERVYIIKIYIRSTLKPWRRLKASIYKGLYTKSSEALRGQWLHLTCPSVANWKVELRMWNAKADFTVPNFLWIWRLIKRHLCLSIVKRSQFSSLNQIKAMKQLYLESNSRRNRCLMDNKMLIFHHRKCSVTKIWGSL